MTQLPDPRRRESPLVRLARHWRLLLEVIATILVIAVCVELLRAMRRVPQPPAPTVARSAAVRPPKPPEAKLPTEPVSLEGAAIAGARTAKVAVIEYSDFQCPYCGVFARDTEPTIRKEYVDTGKALIAFRHVPLESIHPFALKAAESAECAGRQGKFWPMHDLLFQNQKQLDDASLRVRATAAQLDLKAFDGCLAGQLTDRVRQDAAGAKLLAISGTPTFLLGIVQPDGRVKVTLRLSGALPVERFRAALDGLLSGNPITGK